MNSRVMVEFLGSDCRLAACVTIIPQYPMQFAELHAVFLEHNILSPSEFGVLIIDKRIQEFSIACIIYFQGNTFKGGHIAVH